VIAIDVGNVTKDGGKGQREGFDRIQFKVNAFNHRSHQQVHVRRLFVDRKQVNELSALSFFVCLYFFFFDFSFTLSSVFTISGMMEPWMGSFPMYAWTSEVSFIIQGEKSPRAVRIRTWWVCWREKKKKNHQLQQQKEKRESLNHFEHLFQFFQTETLSGKSFV
jgi:hypothetical protein